MHWQIAKPGSAFAATKGVLAKTSEMKVARWNFFTADLLLSNSVNRAFYPAIAAIKTQGDPILQPVAMQNGIQQGKMAFSLMNVFYGYHTR